MSILAITGVIYALIVIAFLVLIIREARARRSNVGLLHVLVAVFWPIWGIWYLCVLIGEKVNSR